MPAYLVAQVRIRDPETYKAYTARSLATIEKHGGRILARGGATEILEGDPSERRVVIIEFASMEAARAWYDSPDYQRARVIRAPISEAQFVTVQGVQ